MPVVNKGLIPVLNSSMEIDLPENIRYEQLKEQLSQHINQLILTDFQKLVSLLYRIDVSEEKLKYLLRENADQDASLIIADLIIERQMEKIRTRQQFSQPDKTHDEENTW